MSYTPSGPGAAKSTSRRNSSGPKREADGPSGTEQISERLRVLVLDDHPAIRDAIVGSVDSHIDIEIVATAATSAEALEQIEKTAPNVAVIDILLTGEGGLELIRKLRSSHPDVRIVVYSTYDEVVYAERAVRAGALGYVMKNEPMKDLVEAIRTVARGDIYLSAAIQKRIFKHAAQAPQGGLGFPIDTLTNREMEVVQLIGAGRTVSDIAETLGLDPKTIETHRRRAKEKLGYDRIADLVQHAAQWVLAQEDKD